MSQKAVIIIGKGFEDSEFLYPYYRLQEAGLAVEVAAAGDRPVTGKYGIPAAPTIECADLGALDFQLVVVPGGHEGPDRARQVPEILQFVAAMDQQGKTIATICHGPWVLISAGILRGRRATCYVGMKDDLINAGAEYLDQDVVVDRNLVSSPHFRNNHQWMARTLAVMQASR